MSTRKHPPQVRHTVLLGFLCLGLFGSHPALSQNSKVDTTDFTQIKLRNKVHLNLGETTVEKLMAALSGQTGLTITAEKYLNERKLIVHIDSLIASTALDALSELNDWSWSPTKPNHILVTRRKLKLDATPAAVPRMMQAAIPKDIRIYFNIQTPSEDLKSTVNPFNGITFGYNEYHQDRIFRTVVIDQSELLNSLAPGILNGEPVSYDTLTQKQRTQLLISLIFPVIRRTDYQLLHGDLLPYVADINNAVFKMSGSNTLLIGSESNEGGVKTGSGFGTVIK